MKRSTLELSCLLLLAITTISYGRQQWQLEQDLPEPRYGHASVYWNDKIFVIGGRDHANAIVAGIQVYDSKSKSWNSLNSELIHPRTNAAAIVFQDRIYVIGGRDHEGPLSSVEILHQPGGTWQEGLPLRVARDGPAAAIIQKRLHAIGGFDENDFSLASTELLEPSSESWLNGNWDLTVGRASLSATTIDDSIFTIGGIWFGPVGTVERYHLAYGAQPRSDMPTARGRMGTAYFRSELWTVGGAAQDGSSAIVELFAPDKNSWRKGPTLPIAREYHSAVVVNDKLYIIGGRDANGEVLARVEFINPPDVVKVDQRPADPPQAPWIASQPNPFRETVQISIYNLPARQTGIEITIFNLLGMTVISEIMQPVTRTKIWDGRDRHGRIVPDGLYFVTINIGDTKVTHKLIKFDSQ